jgi:hypothetical protein
MWKNMAIFDGIRYGIEGIGGEAGDLGHGPWIEEDEQ